MALVSRICPECSLDFQRQSWDIQKYEKKGKVVCCSHSCSAKISNRNRNPKRLLICQNCDKQEQVSETDPRKLYCSQSCYFIHQSDELAVRARQLGKDSAKKISDAKKRMYRENPECHGMLGKSHSKETKNILSKKRKKYFETHDGYWKGKKMSAVTKEKISDTRTEKWTNGDYDYLKMAWAKGRYFFKKADKEVWYRSSWELAFMKYLDTKEGVIHCDYEAIRIPYYDTENKRRHYIPDILVKYTNERKVLYEVKPFSRKDSEINKRKFKAARQYCKERNIGFKVVSERYLKKVGAMQK